MSLYDEYDGVQMKIGERAMLQFHPDDAVDIEDGVYVGWEGVVVIHDGRLLTSFPTIRSKHGSEWLADDALRRLMNEPSPAHQAAGAAAAGGEDVG